MARRAEVGRRRLEGCSPRGVKRTRSQQREALEPLSPGDVPPVVGRQSHPQTGEFCIWPDPVEEHDCHQAPQGPGHSEGQCIQVAIRNGDDVPPTCPWIFRRSCHFRSASYKIKQCLPSRHSRPETGHRRATQSMQISNHLQPVGVRAGARAMTVVFSGRHQHRTIRPTDCSSSHGD